MHKIKAGHATMLFFLLVLVEPTLLAHHHKTYCVYM